MKPLIGITCDYEKGRQERSFLYADYFDAVVAAGGLPVLVPILEERSLRSELLERIDGLVLSGGDDYDPTWYGGPGHERVVSLHPRRQSFDMALGRDLFSRRIPVLGICCGIQLLGIAAGGDLVEDIPGQIPHALAHKGPDGEIVTHPVALSPSSRLSHIFGTDRIDTNSTHHQSLASAGHLQVTARTDDGIVEGVESTTHPFLLGVQWHPEKMPDEPAGELIFQALVAAARPGPSFAPSGREG